MEIFNPCRQWRIQEFVEAWAHHKATKIFSDKYKHHKGETDDGDSRGVISDEGEAYPWVVVGAGEASGELVLHLLWSTSLSLRINVWEGGSLDIEKV
jgi:hypothetical protein